MANPNIVNVSAIYGNTSSYLVSTTSSPFATALVNNPATSGKIFKVNSIVVANSNTGSAANVSVSIFSQDDLGGTGTALAGSISVPAASTIVITDKSTGFYLLEDKSIGVTAGTANVLTVTCSWEELN